MSEALVTIKSDALQAGGQGIDFNSKLFQLKPATISINQPLTQAEGAIKGKLRIAETGQQFDEMKVALLTMPQEARSYNIGEIPSADTLMCFSRDMVKPDDKARVPQALRCEGCPKADWSKWRETKNLKDLPPCGAYYYCLLIDTVYKIPLQMYIRGGSRSSFEAGMLNLSRTFAMMKSQGKNPNIFDITFILSAEKAKKGVNYVIKLANFKPILDDEREAFGDLYLQYVNRGRKTEEQLAEEEAASQEAAVDAAMVQPGSPSAPAGVQEEEITI